MPCLDAVYPPAQVIICVATGTGIAPFRAFWRRAFYENVPSYKFTGLMWIFMGVANSDAKLYDDELQAILAQHPDQVGMPECELSEAKA
jgi:ferredoxin--NADP+ reductase